MNLILNNNWSNSFQTRLNQGNAYQTSSQNREKTMQLKPNVMVNRTDKLIIKEKVLGKTTPIQNLRNFNSQHPPPRSHSDNNGRINQPSSNSQKRLSPKTNFLNKSLSPFGNSSTNIQQLKQYSESLLPKSQGNNKLPLKQQQNRLSNSLIQKYAQETPQKNVLTVLSSIPIKSTPIQRKIVIKQPLLKQRPYQQFLNVDLKTNNMLLDLIQPIAHEFDFKGYSKFVVNASELTNQELFDELYSVQSSEHRESSVERAKIENNQYSQRSRNPNANVLSAGQSVATLSYLEIKAQDQSNTDMYQILKNELREQTDLNIYQLMSDFQPAKFSTKRNGLVAGYGANTNQGISRNYNEDRVAIILNIIKPKEKVYNGSNWPKCSFFGVYDGHGGHVCADFLRDYLHQLIIKDDNFPMNPVQAIKNGFKEAEIMYLDFALQQQREVGDIERSGSCAIIAMIVDDVCYIANTGDSRAIMSVNGGKQVVTLSNDHKPTDVIEVQRILKHGGQIYQNASVINQGGQTQVILGPHRVFPGRLSVCRTFGDIEAKAAHLLGNSEVVVAEPDICQFKITNKHDFVILGCDGIFDKFEDKDCIHTVWQSIINQNKYEENELQYQQQQDPLSRYSHSLCGGAVDSVLKSTAIRRSADNITVVFIAFDNFFNLVRECKGDVTKVEHSKIELQILPLCHRPLLTPNQEILISDQPTSIETLDFQKNIPEIKEEEQQLQQTQPSSGNNESMKIKGYLEPIQQKMTPSQPNPQTYMSYKTAQQVVQSRSMPKYNPQDIKINTQHKPPLYTEGNDHNNITIKPMSAKRKKFFVRGNLAYQQQPIQLQQQNKQPPGKSRNNQLQQILVPKVWSTTINSGQKDLPGVLQQSLTYQGQGEQRQ